MVSKSTKLGQMGRRGFMSALTALGVSQPVAATLTADELEELTDDPKKDVPRIKHYKHTNHEKVEKGLEPPKREPKYYTIPREQWVRTRTAIDAAKRIKRSLSSFELTDSPASSNVEIGITNRVKNDDLGVVVELAHYDGTETSKDRQRLEEVVPATVSGQVTYDGKTEMRESIPVTLEQTRWTEQYFDQVYRPVPGGCEMYDQVTGDATGASNATPAYDNVNNEQVWVTAAHVIDRESGKPMYQNSADENVVGYSTRYIESGNGDAGLVDTGVDATSATWYIASETYDSEDYDWQIQGMVPDSRINDMVAAGEKSRFQGRRTGRDHCEVLDIYWSDGSKNVKLDHDSEGGDSGGAYYELDSDGAYMMGVHAWGGGTTAKGNTMEYIENTLDINV